jgi:hypothetical protein
MPEREPEHSETVIIGGGQAGLSVGHHLARRGRPFLILDANRRVGDAWRKRWDSLRLFTPARYSALAGLPFPAPAHSFPTKDQVADYLEAYATQFRLPVRTGVRVDRPWREGGQFVAAAGERSWRADNVVVAMSSFQVPRMPAFATEFGPDFSWVDLPVFGENEHEPVHHRGVVAGQPGLYFVGLSFLYAMSSGFLPGVDRDAQRIVHTILAGAGRASDRQGPVADNGARRPMGSG